MNRARASATFGVTNIRRRKQITVGRPALTVGLIGRVAISGAHDKEPRVLTFEMISTPAARGAAQDVGLDDVSGHWGINAKDRDGTVL